jgi:aspartate carbamoyltransferase regulatory subunit
MSNQNGFTVLRHGQKKTLLDKLKRRKANGYFRAGSFSDEIIWQDRKFLFPSPKKKVSSGIWVFRSVMHDVRLYIENKRIRSKDRLPVNLWNPKLANFRGKITATDVDHAYWRIAFIMGVISEKTYQKGLLIKDKSIRLAALANLSSSKEYNIIKDGVVTKKTKVLKYDPILQKVYNNIRFTCYEHMTIMANMLGEDFICYKTDCIYYKDTIQNRKKIQLYFKENDFKYKQLVEGMS